MTEHKRTEGEPHNDLTRLANAMLDFMAAQPDANGVRAVVMLFNADDRGGIGIGGYPDDSAAIVDVFLHLRHIFEANGKQLLIAPLGGDG